MALVFDASGAKVVNTVLSDFPNRIPAATQTNLGQIGEMILADKELANNFLNTLVNRICRVIITSRLYENPLAVFKKGSEKYGNIIEEIYVNIAEAHEYDPLISEAEVYKREIPDIGTVFHQENSKLFYKKTIQEADLQKAFTTPDGFRSLISGIVDSIYSGANYDEFLSMKNLFSVAKGQFAYVKTDAPAVATAANIVTNIKSMSNLMEFMRDDLNFVGVKNYTPKSKQVLFIRADIDAIIDVNVLASAFNMSKAEFMGRRILVDNFGDGNDSVYAILADEEFMQVVNTLDKFTEVYNAQGLYWNYFWHVWRIYSCSPFSNAVAFTSGTITDATAVAFANTETTTAKGENIQLKASLTPSGTTSKGVRYKVTGANGGTYISATGLLHIGEQQTGNLTVTITWVADPTVTDSATWAAATGAWTW